MCEIGNHQTVSLVGSGKTAKDWFKLGRAQVYHDHFIKAQVAEGIVVDILNSNDQGSRLPICLELECGSARQLALAILTTIDNMESR